MPSYSIEAIKAALENKKSSNGEKLNYWKPAIGEHEVRFLPAEIKEILYYEKLGDRRVVAPLTFGMEDPVKTAFERLRKTKEGWNIAKLLQPRERHYALVLVRGEEQKGVQVWEFSKEVRNAIYTILAHKDNVDEDMFNAETGYDFTISVTQAVDKQGKPATFNGFPIKSIVPTARKKPSKLSTKAAEASKWLNTMPNLDEHFKSQLKTPEELNEMLEALVAKLAGGPSGSEGSDHTEEMGGSVDSLTLAESKLNGAFDISA